MKDFQLKRQLQDNRVADSEIADLVSVAKRLQRIDQPRLSPAVRQRIESQTFKQRRVPHVAIWSLAGGLATVTMLITSAQFAPKDSPLYAIKRSTDGIWSLFQSDQPQQAADQKKQKIEKVELRSITEEIVESPKNLKPEQPLQPPKDTSPQRPFGGYDQHHDKKSQDIPHDDRDKYKSGQNQNPLQRISDGLRFLFRER